MPGQPGRLRTWQLFPILLGAVCCSTLTAQPATPETNWSVELLQSIGSSDRAQTGVIKNVLLREEGRQALACGMDGTVSLWDLNTGRIVHRFADPEMEGVYCMCLLDDGQRLLTAGIGPGVQLWDVASGEKLRQYDHDATIYSLSVLDDESAFICGDDAGKSIHFAIEKETPIDVYRDGGGDITAVRLLPDQSGFVTGNGDGEVSVWKLGDKKPTAKYAGLENWVCCLRFDETGQQLFGSDYSGNVVLWNVADRQPVWKKESLSGDICWGHFVDEEQIVVVDTSDAMFLMDRASGQASKKSIRIPAAAGFDISDDRRTIWTGGTNLVCGWNLQNGARVFPDDGSMAFAAGISETLVHGNRLYVASTRPRVMVWDLETGQRLDDIEFQSSLAVDWEDFRIVESDDGLVICCDEGFVLTDYDSGTVLHAKKLAASHLVRSPESNLMTYADRQGSRLRQIDPLDGSPQTLAKLDDAGVGDVDSFVFMDANTVAIVIDEYPQKMQIWSVPAKKPVGQLTREEGFELQAGAPGLLIGMDFESNPVVFASAREAQGPLDQSAIRLLLQQLDDPKFAVREQAMRRLVAGGEQVAEALNQASPASLEAQIRIARIQQLMSHALVPDLHRPLEPDPVLQEPVDEVCADPLGQYFLLSVRNGWKSDLLVCQVDRNRWFSVLRYPLRSRAASIVPILQDPGSFSVGYRDGTIDIIRVHAVGEN